MNRRSSCLPFAQVNDLFNLFLCVFAVYFFRKPEMAAVNADLESKINHVDHGVRRCPGGYEAKAVETTRGIRAYTVTTILPPPPWPSTRYRMASPGSAERSCR